MSIVGKACVSLSDSYIYPSIHFQFYSKILKSISLSVRPRTEVSD